MNPPLGWRCPVCGRGLAPDVRECSCIKALDKILGAIENTDFDISQVRVVSDIFEDGPPPEA